MEKNPPNRPKILVIRQVFFLYIYKVYGKKIIDKVEGQTGKYIFNRYDRQNY